MELLPPRNKNIYWIGLYEKGRDGQWEWTDGTPYEYDNWRPGEPNNWAGNDEDCAIVNYNRTHKWFDASCSAAFRYIC